jgi:hypothetical protein
VVRDCPYPGLPCVRGRLMKCGHARSQGERRASSHPRPTDLSVGGEPFLPPAPARNSTLQASCCLPHVPVMQTTDRRQPDDSTRFEHGQAAIAVGGWAAEVLSSHRANPRLRSSHHQSQSRGRGRDKGAFFRAPTRFQGRGESLPPSVVLCDPVILSPPTPAGFTQCMLDVHLARPCQPPPGVL